MYLSLVKWTHLQLQVLIAELLVHLPQPCRLTLQLTVLSFERLLVIIQQHHLALQPLNLLDVAVVLIQHELSLVQRRQQPVDVPRVALAAGHFTKSLQQDPRRVHQPAIFGHLLQLPDLLLSETGVPQPLPLLLGLSGLYVLRQAREQPKAMLARLAIW